MIRSYGEENPRVGPILKFGFWIGGGDQDGKSFVRPETMLIALRLQRDLTLKEAPGDGALSPGTSPSLARRGRASERRSPNPTFTVSAIASGLLNAD